jgi:hypothetical protein
MKKVLIHGILVLLTHEFAFSQNLKLLENPAQISIDPVAKTGSVMLQIQNQSQQTQQLSLWAEDFESSTTKHKLGAKINFSDDTGSAPKVTYARAFKPGEKAAIKMDVSNVWEAGESKTVLHDAGETLGYVLAMNDRFPLNVTAVSEAGLAEIHLVRCRPATLIFKNGDTNSYLIRWSLRLKGRVLEGSSALHIGPNNQAVVTFKPPDDWFSAPLCTLFKDEDRNAELEISYSPEPDTGYRFLPSRTTMVKVHLSAWPEGLNQAFAYLALFGLLLLGGITSLMLTFGLPNGLQRLALKDRIETVSNAISAISRSVDSRLRVWLRVERKRLNELLESRRAFSPDLNDVFTQVDLGIKTLAAKVEVVNQLDLRRKKLAESSSRHELGPTSIAKVDTALQKCADILLRPQISDSDLTAARASLADADKILADKGQNQQDKMELCNRIKDAAGILASEFESDAGKKIKDDFQCLFSALDDRFQDSAKVRSEDIVYLDDSLSRIELLREFLRRRCPSDGGLDKDGVTRFLDKLKTSGWEGFREARLFLREVVEQIDANELKEALNNKGARIEINRSPRQNEPLEFTLVFSGRLKDAAAREEWSYKWSFSDGLEEFTTSATVWHYFRLPDTHTVTVRCEDLEGKPLQDDDKKLPSLTMRVEPESKPFLGARGKIELVKLAIALVAAAIGLIAGARDQLLKLDAVPGLIAVFAAGFGADTIKNLIKK